MALKPLWDNIWGVPVYYRPFREGSTLHTPFARQRKKVECILLIKEVGKDCTEAWPGMFAVLPEDSGGTVVNIVKEDGEIEYRYCVSEKVILALWDGALPDSTTEPDVVTLED